MNNNTVTHTVMVIVTETQNFQIAMLTFFHRKMLNMLKTLKCWNRIYIPKKIRDMHTQKIVLKTTNKTHAVIAQSTEHWTLDRNGQVQDSLCKKVLWAP